ncbi:hypothetical protein ACQP1P_27120 [Dactylosporangium sp. CA-052675]|uniref:hypothetical protein n=1 Tax=Dactylosporangium sp. CA-052675 TaxID=3239927 RepID=UPI003D9069A9
MDLGNGTATPAAEPVPSGCRYPLSTTQSRGASPPPVRRTSHRSGTAGNTARLPPPAACRPLVSASGRAQCRCMPARSSAVSSSKACPTISSLICATSPLTSRVPSKYGSRL